VKTKPKSFARLALVLAVLVSNSYLIQESKAGSFTNTGSLNTTRYSHSATLLENGKVLVAGGENNSAYLASAELYEPTSETWTNTGSLTQVHSDHTATLLPNGKVLVAGGLTRYFPIFYSSAAELYDPVTGTWTATGAMTNQRARHTATLLPSIWPETPDFWNGVGR
jgi:hypothetical protein